LCSPFAPRVQEGYSPDQEWFCCRIANKKVCKKGNSRVQLPWLGNWDIFLS
jgi:hypothetical protein